MVTEYNENKTRTTTTTTTSRSSSSSTIACARAREAEINVQVEDLKDLYRRAIGQPMSAICEASLRRSLEGGEPYIYYHYALEETAYAPRPSWRYTLAIVRRLAAQGVSEDELLMALSLRP